MADHADHHHHAAAEKPTMNVVMGFALFFAMAAILLALVAAIRGSAVLLDITAILGAIAIGVGILGVIVGKARGGSSRGFAAVFLIGGVAIITWLVVGVWVGV